MNPIVEKSCKCSICKKDFSNISNLNKHVRRIHNEEPTSSCKTIHCPDSSCEAKFDRRYKLCKHIHASHGIKIEFQRITFPTLAEFDQWKACIEKETKSFYIHSRGTKISMKGLKNKQLQCNRSGFYQSTSVGKRRLKRTGTVKINGTCPSFMDVTETENGVKVGFLKTHFGHDCDISHVYPTSAERNDIANSPSTQRVRRFQMQNDKEIAANQEEKILIDTQQKILQALISVNKNVANQATVLNDMKKQMDIISKKQNVLIAILNAHTQILAKIGNVELM